MLKYFETNIIVHFVRLFLLNGGTQGDMPPSFTYCCLWLSPTIYSDGTMFLPKTVIPISINMLLRKAFKTFKCNFYSNINTKYLHFVKKMLFKVR